MKNKKITLDNRLFIAKYLSSKNIYLFKDFSISCHDVTLPAQILALTHCTKSLMGYN